MGQHEVESFGERQWRKRRGGEVVVWNRVAADDRHVGRPRGVGHEVAGSGGVGPYPGFAGGDLSPERGG